MRSVSERIIYSVGLIQVALGKMSDVADQRRRRRPEQSEGEVGSILFWGFLSLFYESSLGVTYDVGLTTQVVGMTAQKKRCVLPTKSEGGQPILVG